jgi:hypothetical protein
MNFEQIEKGDFTMKKTLTLAAVMLLAASLAHAQLGTTSPTNILSVTVGPEAALSIGGTGTTTFTTAGNFAPYLGTTSMNYFIRTSETGGTGTVTAKITTDFGAGGPSVGSPLATDALTYACTVALPGTACTGPVTASTTATTSVATFGTAAHSAKAGNAASVSWTLPNDPVYKVGTYTATVTFTISAT